MLSHSASRNDLTNLQITELQILLTQAYKSRFGSSDKKISFWSKQDMHDIATYISMLHSPES